MLYYAVPSESLLKVLERSFNKTAYQSCTAVARYSRGMTVCTTDVTKIVFDTGDEFTLDKPFPIVDDPEQFIEVSWSEFTSKGSFLPDQHSMDKDTLLCKTGEFMAYFSPEPSISFLVGRATVDGKRPGTIFLSNNSLAEKVLRSLFRRHEPIEIKDDQDVEKPLRELLDRLCKV